MIASSPHGSTALAWLRSLFLLTCGLWAVLAGAQVAPLPTITTFNPAAVSPGTAVTITGAGFTGATAVTFNGTRARFKVASEMTIVAVVPDKATSGPIVVSGPHWTAGSSTVFTVLAAPPGWQEARRRWYLPAFTNYHPDNSPPDINTSAFSPRTSLIAAAQGFTEVALYQTDGTLVRTINVAQSRITSLAFSPDGEVLASAGHNEAGEVNGDEAIKLWRVSDGAYLGLLPGITGITRLVFSPDGLLLAVVCLEKDGQGNTRGSVRLLRLSDGACLQTLTGDASFAAIAFSPDGQTLVTGSNPARGIHDLIKFWRVSDGACLCTTANGPQCVRALAISPDGQTLAAGGYNDRDTYFEGIVQLLRMSDAAPLRTISTYDATVYACAFSPDGQTLAAGAEIDTIRFWRVSDGACLQTCKSSQFEYTMLAFSADGQLLVAGGEFAALELWRVSDGTCVRTLTGPAPPSSTMAFSPDAQCLFTGDSGSVQNRQASDGAYLRTLREFPGMPPMFPPVLSPDGQWLAYCMPGMGNDSWLDVTRMSDGARILTAGMGWATALAFTADGQMLVAASDGQTPGTHVVKCWRMSDGTCLRTWTWTSSGVFPLVVSPNGRVVVVAGYEVPANGKCSGVIRRWRVSDGAALPVIRLGDNIPRVLAVAPDGQTLAVGADTIELRRFSDGAHLRTIRGHSGITTSLAFSPDGRMLVSGGGDHTLKCWRVSDGACLQVLPGYGAPVGTLTFSPDGRSLATSGGDGVACWEFTVPTLASFTPASGPAGTRVTLFGQDLAGATAVTFNGRAASFTVVDDTTLTACVPSGAVSGRISVTTPNGKTVSLDRFLAIPTPPLTAVTLTASPTTSQPVHTPITLTAKATGGGVVEYKFRVCEGGQWRDLSGYTTTPTCVWQPTQAGKYTLAVCARTVGKNVPYAVKRTIRYTIW